MKFKILIIPTSVFLLSGAFSALSDQRSTAPEETDLGFDFMVIGEMISKKHIQNWKAWKQASVDCEECALKQPYPGDDQDPSLATGSFFKSKFNKR